MGGTGGGGRVGGALDEEAGTSQTIRVRATASECSVGKQWFTIRVTKLDDNPVLISDAVAAGNTVAESAVVGTVVGVTALGADADTEAGRAACTVSV